MSRERRTAGASAGGGGAPVLAYLFTLRRARHPLQHTWSRYFAGCRAGSYRLHIHVDPTINATMAAHLSEAGPGAKYFNRANTIPSDQLIKVHRFGFSLVQARMKLLRHAMGPGAEGRAAPLFYTYVSESCAPIASCATVHSHLARSAREPSPRSYIGELPYAFFAQWMAKYIATAEWAHEFEARCSQCKAVGIQPTSFRVSPGWITLFRDHAAVLLEKEALHEPVFAAWTNSKRAPWCLDEVYWSTLAQHLGLPVTGMLMTYMESGDPKTGHAQIFSEHNVSHLWRQPPPFFFARKCLTTPRMDAALAMRMGAVSLSDSQTRMITP